MCRTCSSHAIFHTIPFIYLMEKERILGNAMNVPALSYNQKQRQKYTFRGHHEVFNIWNPHLAANVDFMGIETRGPPHQQHVRDIEGLTIGHVPRQLCNIISIPMRVHRTLKHAICIYMGEMVHDHQGPKLKVMYLLEFDPGVSLQTIANHMQMYKCVHSENFYCCISLCYENLVRLN